MIGGREGNRRKKTSRRGHCRTSASEGLVMRSGGDWKHKAGKVTDIYGGGRKKLEEVSNFPQGEVSHSTLAGVLGVSSCSPQSPLREVFLDSVGKI